jgi:hypothetical protein
MLNPDQIEKVRGTLYTSGWNDVMKPMLLNRGRMAVKALVLTRTERDAEMKGTDFATDEDVLRAIIRDVEWMLNIWDNEVNAANHNRLRDELDAANGSEPANLAR